MHPYKSLPDHCFWRGAIAGVAPEAVDPVVNAKFQIGRSDKVVTAGSCFAQHIARYLQRSGFSYFVTETAHPLVRHFAGDYNYGVFSARYGNLYTSRQLWQLLQRAYGLYAPEEDCWRREDGRFIDPFRPQIQPNGFASLAEFRADRAQHLAAVRRAVEELDVFVFTLGLTEVWLAKRDGAAFPLCPGVAGGEFDPDKHEFHNLGVAEVVADLEQSLAFVRSKNPRARVVLTVSPVPLAATAEHRSVLVSTTLSKSVLRVAADLVSADKPDVAYFPSYEIITGAHARGRYFADDLRNVTEAGVAHVMRLFMQHYAGEAPNDATAVSAATTAAAAAQSQAARAQQPPLGSHKEYNNGPIARQTATRIKARIAKSDDGWCADLDGRRITIKQGGSPVQEFLPGWRPLFIFAGLPPLYLLELENDDGQQVTWIFDAEMNLLGDALRHLPVAVIDLLRKHGPDFIERIFRQLVCAPKPCLDDDLVEFFAIHRNLRQQLFDLWSSDFQPEHHQIEIDPGITREEDIGTIPFSVSVEHLTKVLQRHPMTQLAAAASSQELSWPSPSIGDLISTDVAVYLETGIAYRLYDPAVKTVYYVLVVRYNKAQIIGLYWPDLNRLYTLKGLPSHLLSVYMPLPCLALTKHMFAYGDMFLLYSQYPKRDLSFLIEGGFGQHLGVYLWHQMSGLAEMIRQVPAEKIPEIVVMAAADGSEKFGKLDDLYPQLAEKLNREHQTDASLIEYAYRSRRFMVRIADHRVTRDLAKRIVTVNEHDPSLVSEQQRYERVRRAGGPILALGLRTENRTLVDLPGFCVRVLRHMLQRVPRLTVVVDGHNGTRTGSTTRIYPSHYEEMATTSPFDLERELVGLLQASFGSEIEIVDNIGASIGASIFWIERSHFFIAPWGAWLAKGRWVCNKPGIILSSKWNLRHRHDLHIYDREPDIESPSPVHFIDEEFITDRPDAAVLYMGPNFSAESNYSFEVDEQAVFGAVDQFLACAASQAAAAAADAEPAMDAFAAYQRSMERAAQVVCEEEMLDGR